MINHIILVGRLSANVQLAHTSNNIPYARFTIAVSRNSNRNITDFINCVAWRANAEFLAKYTGKGTLIAVEGELNSNQYTSNKTDSIVRSYEVTASSIKILESKEVIQARQEATNNAFTPSANHQTPKQPSFNNAQSKQPTNEQLHDFSAFEFNEVEEDVFGDIKSSLN